VKKKMMLLAAATALSWAPLQAGELNGEPYYAFSKSRILDWRGGGLTKQEIEYDTMYVFTYPYKSTPAVLVKKQVTDENNVTRDRLFAYLGINPATYEFANNDVSVLSYYHEDSFGNGMLRFCDDKNAFNIYDGIVSDEHNITAPTIIPEVDENTTVELPVRLVKVFLEESNSGAIYATGLSDETLVKKFFVYKKEALEKRFRSIWNAKVQADKQRLLPLEKFSLVTVRCNSKKGMQ